MHRPQTKEEVLAYLRCIRLRASLVQTEVDFLGVAVNNDLMSPEDAQLYIENFGMDYMGLRDNQKPDSK